MSGNEWQIGEPPRPGPAPVPPYTRYAAPAPPKDEQPDLPGPIAMPSASDGVQPDGAAQDAPAQASAQDLSAVSLILGCAAAGFLLFGLAAALSSLLGAIGLTFALQARRAGDNTLVRRAACVMNLAGLAAGIPVCLVFCYLLKAAGIW